MKLLFTSVMLIIIVSVSSAQVTFEKKYNYSVFPETIWTNIYSLPGMPVFSAKLKDKPDFELNAFPNPAENP